MMFIAPIEAAPDVLSFAGVDILLLIALILVFVGVVILLTEAPLARSRRRRKQRQIHRLQKAKGDAFEVYVLNLFDGSSFKLLHRTEDRNWINPDGTRRRWHRYSPKEKWPDLLFRHGSFFGKKIFVEAKFRSSEEGLVNLSSYDQIRRYRFYAKKKHALCFVAIGLGGSPNNPNRLSLIPLDSVYPTVYLTTFRKYERNPRIFIRWEDIYQH